MCITLNEWFVENKNLLATMYLLFKNYSPVSHVSKQNTHTSNTEEDNTGKG